MSDKWLWLRFPEADSQNGKVWDDLGSLAKLLPFHYMLNTTALVVAVNTGKVELENPAQEKKTKDALRRLVHRIKDAVHHIGMRRPVLMVAHDSRQHSRGENAREKLQEWSSDQAWHGGEFVLYAPRPPADPSGQGEQEKPPDWVTEFCKNIAFPTVRGEPLWIPQIDAHNFAVRFLREMAQSPDRPDLVPPLLDAVQKQQSNDPLIRDLLPGLDHSGASSEARPTAPEGPKKQWGGKIIRKVRSLKLEHVRGCIGTTILKPLDGDIVILSGSNGLGKSSVLSAIAALLSGQTEEFPAEWLSKGKDSGWRITINALVDGSDEVELTAGSPEAGKIVPEEEWAQYRQKLKQDLGKPVGGSEKELSTLIRSATLVQGEDIQEVLSSGMDLNSFIGHDYRSEILEIRQNGETAKNRFDDEIEAVGRLIRDAKHCKIKTPLNKFIDAWNAWVHNDHETSKKLGLDRLPPVEKWYGSDHAGWQELSRQLRKFERVAGDSLQGDSPQLVFTPDRLVEFWEAAKTALERINRYVNQEQNPDVAAEIGQKRVTLEQMKREHAFDTYEELLKWVEPSGGEQQLSLDRVLACLRDNTDKWRSPPPQLQHAANGIIEGVTQEFHRIHLPALANLATSFAKEVDRRRSALEKYRDLEKELEQQESPVAAEADIANLIGLWTKFDEHKVRDEKQRLTTDVSAIETKLKSLETDQQRLNALTKSIGKAEDSGFREIERKILSIPVDEDQLTDLPQEPKDSPQEEDDRLPSLSDQELVEQQERLFRKTFEQVIDHFPGFSRFDAVAVKSEQGRMEHVAGEVNDHPLHWKGFSSGQKGQAALAWLLARTQILSRWLPHRILLLDDPCAFFDTGNLAPFAAWLRQIAYAEESGRESLSRQVLLSTPDEETLERLLAHLIPPKGHSLRVVQFESWSTAHGPSTTIYNIPPEPLANSTNDGTTPPKESPIHNSLKLYFREGAYEGARA